MKTVTIIKTLQKWMGENAKKGSIFARGSNQQLFNHNGRWESVETVPVTDTSVIIDQTLLDVIDLGEIVLIRQGGQVFRVFVRA